MIYGEVKTRDNPGKGTPYITRVSKHGMWHDKAQRSKTPYP